MKMEDMILISIDDHIVEPADMFDRHTPAAFKGRMPKCVRAKDNAVVWVVEEEGVAYRGSGLNAVAGRRPEHYGVDPEKFEDMRKGCYDARARVEDQDVNGILASLNFPTWPTFAGGRIFEFRNKELALAVIRAYNDWHIDEWCGEHPGRFIPCAMVPMWDPVLAAAEVRRVNAKGCHAISLPPQPARMGFPSIHGDHWDPLWRACDELGVVCCLHIGDATGAVTSMDAPVDVFISNMPVSLYATASDLVFSPVLRKFGNIHFALTEGGAGWVPHFLERIDYVYRHHHAWTKQDFGGRLPSEVFKQHVSLCFIDDQTAVENRYRCGIDNLTYEVDYPHSDCTWPNSPEVLWESLKSIPDADIDKITHLNAMRIYSFDPFKHIPRQDCTVAALRRRAAHVDVAPLEVNVPEHMTKGRTGIMTLEAYNRLNSLEDEVHRVA
ncbi:MAG: amidohydrolase family protein [Gammaproteobacteria bacterium]